MSASDQLHEAVRAIVRDELHQPGPTAVAEKLAWVSLIFLFLLAIDISAIIWSLADVWEQPVFKLFVGSVPTLVGVGFLATYKERLQEIVRSIASRRWFRTVVILALVLIVLPVLMKYQVPVKLSDPTLDVFIDGQKVNTGLERAGVTHVPVRGLREHELRVVGYGAEDKARKVSYRLRASDLLATLVPLRGSPFEVGLLVPLTVGIEDSTIRSVKVAGTFPELFSRGVPEPFEDVLPLPKGRQEVSIKASRGTEAQELLLPPGHYSIRYVGSKCTSAPDTVTVNPGEAGSISLDPCE